ncbi:MAG TPA: hypothetical protein DD706_17750 [Nitrospiraceae bacterium]|nr:hypothetical protein [Nitrospiraceae bacterium]
MGPARHHSLRLRPAIGVTARLEEIQSLPESLPRHQFFQLRPILRIIPPTLCATPSFLKIIMMPKQDLWDFIPTFY